MKKALLYLVPILFCFGIGYLSGFLQQDAIENWYPGLNKSTLTPPNIVFPVVWSFLYICIGISAGTLISGPAGSRKWGGITLFIIQILINLNWSISFFYFQNPLLGLLNILLLDLLAIVYAIVVYPYKKVSFWFFLPYMLWIFFATYLNLYIVLNN